MGPAAAGDQWTVINDGNLGGGILVSVAGTLANMRRRDVRGGRQRADIAPGGDPFVMIGTLTEEDPGCATTVESGNLVVLGTFTQSAGDVTINPGTSLTVTQGYTEAGGTLTDNGILSLSQGLQIQAGASFSGLGSIIGDVINAGLFAIGAADGSVIGALTITGNYTQTSSGTLVEAANSSAADKLTVTGQASLDGTFKFLLAGGYAPSPGTSFNLLGYGSRSGTFASLSLPTLTSGTWDPRYDDPTYPNAFSLWVV
jgi:hypothetical protein